MARACLRPGVPSHTGAVSRRMRIEAEERAAAREREARAERDKVAMQLRNGVSSQLQSCEQARAERDKVAMQLWSEAQREVYDRVVEGHISSLRLAEISRDRVVEGHSLPEITRDYTRLPEIASSRDTHCQRRL